MKKELLKIIFLFIMTTMLVGCNKGKLIEIDFEELNIKLENKESFVLVVAREDCSHCQDYEKTLNQLIKKYNVDIHIIDVSLLEEVEENIFTSLFSFPRGLSTPTTIFVENGKETTTYDRIMGAASLTEVVSSLTKKGYLG